MFLNLLERSRNYTWVHPFTVYNLYNLKDKKIHYFETMAKQIIASLIGRSYVWRGAWYKMHWSKSRNQQCFRYVSDFVIRRFWVALIYWKNKFSKIYHRIRFSNVHIQCLLYTLDALVDFWQARSSPSLRGAFFSDFPDQRTSNKLTLPQEMRGHVHKTL